MQPKMFVISGFSASGKDTLLEAMIDELNLSPIISHTTRPVRENEKHGREYIFTTKEQFLSLINNKEMVEFREYIGSEGNWFYGVSYGSIDSQVDSIVVLDLDGAKALKDRYGERVVTIFVDAKNDIRRQRAKRRGSFSKDEWEARSISDEKIFTREEISHYDLILENTKLDQSIEVLRTFIIKNRGC